MKAGGERAGRLCPVPWLFCGPIVGQRHFWEGMKAGSKGAWRPRTNHPLDCLSYSRIFHRRSHLTLAAPRPNNALGAQGAVGNKGEMQFAGESRMSRSHTCFVVLLVGADTTAFAILLLLFFSSCNVDATQLRKAEPFGHA